MPINDPGLRIEKYDPSRHSHDDFDCGVDRLNNFLKHTAKKQQKDNMTSVYVITADGTPNILGYHAVNAGRMDAKALQRPPKGTPAHGEIPVLFLGQIAISRHHQNQGIGSILMHHVFEKAGIVAGQVGCYAILLDVISDGGEEMMKQRKEWYEKFGFVSFTDEPSRMFITIQQIRESLTS